MRNRKDLRIYQGEWRISEEEQIREGKGIVYLPNGEIFEGFYNNDQATGYGRLIEDTGEVFQGNWKENMRNG